MIANMDNRRILLTIFTTIILTSTINCELYTAIVDLEELLDSESILITTLDDYINNVESKLKHLRLYQQKYYNEHLIAKQNIQEYLSNPINAYLLVKRLTTDWKHVEYLIEDLSNVKDDYPLILNNSKSDNNEEEEKNGGLKLPNDEDLNGAAVALIRLQDTYRLDTNAIANGILNGIQFPTELSVDDCFELGRQLYNNGDFYHTILWMYETKKRFHLYEQEQQKQQQTKYVDILEYLAFSIYMEGNLQIAIDLTKELLQLAPDHSRAKGNLVFYENKIKELEKEHDNKIKEKRRPDYDALPERELYEMLCRNEIKPPQKVLSKLRCRYRKKRHPFTWIAPFKEEEMSLEPLIVVYHDVLYDDEINTIKQLAQPRFRRATVQNHKTGELETAQYRISKSAWLKNDEHEHVQTVVQRVEDITELTQTTAEELQVVNYGIGGHYEPHFDFARKDEGNAFKSLGTGNRIATILFYMSDVLQGGATVFPSIKTALWPQKGSAAFWYNLHPSGEGDYLTRHAACPVLSGSKWVANKWIHERGQEFLRPCRLEPDPIEPDMRLVNK
ncbi:prolyl 4-hydroxylase subunit alpha-2 isoform X2 [Chrysoperla carnea]|uniref:prolyl 4-hydroxylase subunit alpha-2 isoform X2 n=1 Tax=Chrysoperla carnea TaxID=189513 RepID=UPI001D081F43|nr:prolyl 4-hydroxylase subunit alpha-2 isoform X2 [Chrysoperla carnea]